MRQDFIEYLVTQLGSADAGFAQAAPEVHGAHIAPPPPPPADVFAPAVAEAVEKLNNAIEGVKIITIIGTGTVRIILLASNMDSPHGLL